MPSSQWAHVLTNSVCKQFVCMMAGACVYTLSHHVACILLCRALQEQRLCKCKRRTTSLQVQEAFVEICGQAHTRAHIPMLLFTFSSAARCRYGFSAMEVQEAFVKIREQARAYLERPAELMAGLNLLSTTNLDYFGVGPAWVVPADSASHKCHALHKCFALRHRLVLNDLFANHDCFALQWSDSTPALHITIASPGIQSMLGSPSSKSIELVCKPGA
eukprot:1148434-Pelagomonas_calceolata.AAC.2